MVKKEQCLWGKRIQKILIPAYSSGYESWFQAITRHKLNYRKVISWRYNSIHNNGHILPVAFFFSFLWIHLIPKGKKKKNHLPSLSVSCQMIFLLFCRNRNKKHLWCNCVLRVDDASIPIFTNNFTEGHFLKDGEAFSQSFCFNFILYSKVRKTVVLKGYINDTLLPFFFYL